MSPDGASLIRLRARDDAVYVGAGRCVLATGRDGFVRGTGEQGLLVHETRLLSRYVYTIDGVSPSPVALSSVEPHSWLGYYVTYPPGVDAGEPDHGSGNQPDVSRETLELRISRVVGEGVHEDVDLTNFSPSPTRFRLELALDGDFADLAELSGTRLQRGRIRRRWTAHPGGGELRIAYRATHDYDRQGNRGRATIRRALAVRVDGAGSAPGRGWGRLGFDVALAPGASWHACVLLVPEIDGVTLPAPPLCRDFGGAHETGRLRAIFLSESTRLTSPESETLAPVVFTALERARRDLAGLRLFDLDHDERSWTMAAGLPIYLALFGRDTLTAAWQAALLGPEMMRGTLEELPKWQGREVNDWRDEQPGRMIHEAHTGPLEALRFNPRDRYYGSVTTSGFYPFVLSELWHWTGDRERVAPLVAPALAALAWLERHGDREGDGFYEYRTRSVDGVKHQAWKDSGDAIVDGRGAPVEPPIATCEEQGFIYVAKLHLSEVLWWLDRKDEARVLFREAQELRKRFGEAFWMEEEGYLALGLGPDKRPIRAIASNAGHCLAAGIVESSQAERVASRMLEPDLFSGWGVRTLSADNPAYNPYSYHRGSVWPVEQGTFAMAFVRYGLVPQLQRLCRAQFEAASLFEHCRLPEVIGGHARDADHPFPALYPRSNSPQAWSASAVVSFVQALLGLYPYAPLHLLLVDPQLPDWLPEITLSNLRVGEGSATIRFFRAGESSGYEVLDKRGPLHVVRQPSPWSLTASFAERLKDALTSLLPGR